MGIRSTAKRTLDDLSTASRAVGGAAEWQTIALVAVTVVAVTALLMATAALLTSGETEE